MQFTLRALLIAALGLFFLNSCREKKEIYGKSGSGGLQLKSDTVASLGSKATSEDATLLADLRGTTSSHAPAGVRPDPDTFIRNLLKLHRSDGTIIARELGRIEPFRQLLGGANQDFSIVPQDSYDATSLLALNEVLGEICSGLVAPNSNLHGNWSSILPNTPSDIQGNVSFLFRSFQRPT